MSWEARLQVTVTVVVTVLLVIVAGRQHHVPAPAPVTTTVQQQADCPPGSTYVDDLGECMPNAPAEPAPVLTD